MPDASTQTILPSEPSFEKSDQKNGVTSSRRRRAWIFLQPIFFAILGTIAAILLLEVGFRLLPKTKGINPVADRPHKFFLARGTPVTPDLTQLGEKAPGEFRVVVIGDSFTEGQGVQLDDAFPARLERLFNLGARDRHAVVFNAGIRGYSTVQELEVLKKALQLVAPDMIILQITLNDPEIQPYRVQHPYLDEHGRVKLTSPIFSFWMSLRFVVERILNTQTHRAYIDYYFDLFNNPTTWNRFAKAIVGFKELTSKAGVPLFAVVFPLFSHSLDDKYPFQPLHDKLDSFLENEGLEFIDLNKDYRGMNPERLQIEPGQDSHPNEIAHRVAAENIYLHLAKRHFIPQEFLNKRTLASR